MPPADFPQFDRFLRTVHRRTRLLRLIESIGLAVTIACGLGLPLIFLLAWRGVRAPEAPVLILALGALAGIGWALTHAATPLQAAMEADRQLGLADLLGSALLLRREATDPWKAAVLAEAESRCRSLSASSILVRRLSRRAWSGIALTIGLVLTLSAWIGAPAETLAHGSSAGSTPASLANNDARPLLEPINPSSRNSAAPPDGQDATDSSALLDQRNTATDPSPSQAASTGRPDTGADGQGGTLSRSNVQQPDAGPQPQRGGPGLPSAATGHTAGGNADAAESSTGVGQAGGTVAHSSPRPSPIAPWTAAGWPGAVESAQHQIDSGQVPASYRDLVREYFQRR